MRIVIIGGGTAGHMAAAHLSKHRSDAEILHLYDRDRPTIGVGEGTTPDFVRWLETIGISIDQLCETCQATHKRGILFEGWGDFQSKFIHEFFPRSDQAVHFAAANLPDLLQSRSRTVHINDSAKCISSSDSHISVQTTGGQCIASDLMIDARGFQSHSKSVAHQFDWITTDAAFVTKVPVVLDQRTTRAIARPHGWMFSIPLANETSFGYIYNASITSPEIVQSDFRDFLVDQRMPINTSFRSLRFPNFVRRKIFDGQVLHIGNSASFVEPLEATAIGVTILQLHLLIHWLELIDLGMDRTIAVDRINRIHEDTLLKVSMFIAWHYAAGSVYDTPFWRRAIASYREMLKLPGFANLLGQFDAIQHASHEISPETIAKLNTSQDVTRYFSDDLHRENFGGYNQLSFAQLANGLGQNPRFEQRRIAS